jgi:hypothetical protein
MDKRADLDYLLQTDLIESIPSIGKEPWQPLYVSRDEEPDRFGTYCALLTSVAAESALDHDSWDLHIGDGLPGFSQSWSEGGMRTKYHRFGSTGDIRALGKLCTSPRFRGWRSENAMDRMMQREHVHLRRGCGHG